MEAERTPALPENQLAEDQIQVGNEVVIEDSTQDGDNHQNSVVIVSDDDTVRRLHLSQNEGAVQLSRIVFAAPGAPVEQSINYPGPTGEIAINANVVNIDVSDDEGESFFNYFSSCLI